MGTTEKIELLRNAFQTEAEFDRVLTKMADAALAQQRNRLAEYDRELLGFERQYGLSSAALHKKFEAGLAGDSADFFEWNGLYELRLRVAEKVRNLEQFQ